MTPIWKNLTVCLLALGLVVLPAVGMAADFEIFWDSNCDAEADLEGYFIYYRQDASVVDDPGAAVDLYVALTDIDFDPDNPSLLIAGLLDDVRYCFAVTAWYGDEESGLSDELCGLNGTYRSDSEPDPTLDQDPDSDPDPESDTDSTQGFGLNTEMESTSGDGISGGSGCFIGSLR
jgi:hypothetical protein